MPGIHCRIWGTVTRPGWLSLAGRGRPLEPSSDADPAQRLGREQQLGSRLGPASDQIALLKSPWLAWRLGCGQQLENKECKPFKHVASLSPRTGKVESMIYLLSGHGNRAGAFNNTDTKSFTARGPAAATTGSGHCPTAPLSYLGLRGAPTGKRG